MKHLARKSALSAKLSAGKVFIVEDFSFEAPKTKAFADILAALNVAGQKPVVVTSDYEKEVYLSSRNLPKTKVLRATDLNTYEVMNAGALVLSEGAVEKIKEAFAN